MVKTEGPFLDAQFILSIIVIIYYSSILYVISTAKSAMLRAAFFHIFVVTGICDILGIVALEWIRAEFKSTFGPSLEFVTRLTASMTGINFFTHILGCFLMTCNRFTAVRFPQQQSNIWSTRNVWALLTFEIVFSIVIHYQVLATVFVYKPKPGGGWIRVGRSGSINETRIMESAITLTYELVSIVIISYTIYLVNKELQKSNRKLARDVGLLFVTVINCITSILECIYDISFLFHVEIPALQWIYDLYEINFFFVMSINAYSIIFLSRALRQEIRRRLCWKPVETHSFHTTVVRAF